MNFFFDPKLNHFLQSFHNPFLTVSMLAVSFFGSQVFLMLAAGFIFFRVGWKKGFVFVQMVLWSFILTDFLKQLLYLPRPIQVDPSLLTFNEYLPGWLVESLADNPGFPSGHVCSTVAIWGGILIMFKGRIQKIIGIALMVLMPISRMYLARHFLADVLGGFLLGTFIVFAAFAPLIRSQQDPLFVKDYRSIPFVAFLLLPLLLNMIPDFPSNELGQLFGFNVAIFCLLFFAALKTSLLGASQFLIAVFIFALLNVALSNLHFLPNPWIHFFMSAIPMTSALLVASSSAKFSKKVGI
jgi:membrane-associated phospholipid phosphatase